MTARSIATVVLAGGLFCFSATSALAQDARSLALGGSSIANGQGIQGTLANPSALMRYKREGQKGHLHMGAYADFRDDAELSDTLKDEEDLIDDLDAEIDRISNSTLTCNIITATNDTECLSGTQLLGELSARVLNVVNTVDGEALTANASALLGAGYSQWNIPVAFFVKASATGAGVPDIADSDRDYISTFVDVLSDDSLTFGELQNSVPLDIDIANQTLEVTPPEFLPLRLMGLKMTHSRLKINVTQTRSKKARLLQTLASPRYFRNIQCDYQQLRGTLSEKKLKPTKILCSRPHRS